jgi:hypothetical protein
MAIKNSGAVIFWITKKFLNSGWCDAELQNFLQKYVNKPKEVLIIPIIHKEVDLEDFENVFLTNLKYYKIKDTDSIEKIANESVPSMRNFFKINS